MIERGSPLSAVTQITSQEFPKHVPLMKAPNFNVGDETIHDRTGQAVVNRDESSHEQTMLNEVNMDFRIPGLPHSVVTQAENSRVRELVKKIVNHPDRHALQQDLRQNQAYNPFSTTTKQMIQDVCNVELSYWSEGSVYCTCGRLLKESVANRSYIVYTLDFLSIPEYVIKKGRPHCHRYGKTPEKKEYYLAHNLTKRCIKRGFTGIHDRFLRDNVFRENYRDEDVCRKWDDLAEEEELTYRMSEPFTTDKIGESLSISLETLAGH